MKVWYEIEAEIKARYETLRESQRTGFRSVGCDHPENKQEYRRKKIANGLHQLRKQCMGCGAVMARNFKHTEVDDFNALPLIDEVMQRKSEQIYQYYGCSYEVEQRALNTAFWELYEQHLNSPQWFAKRDRVMDRAAGTCEGCRERAPAHVHHMSYKHLGDELLFELVALCHNCHQKLHPHREIA